MEATRPTTQKWCGGSGVLLSNGICRLLGPPPPPKKSPTPLLISQYHFNFQSPSYVLSHFFLFLQCHFQRTMDRLVYNTKQNSRVLKLKLYFILKLEFIIIIIWVYVNNIFIVSLFTCVGDSACKPNEREVFWSTQKISRDFSIVQWGMHWLRAGF